MFRDRVQILSETEAKNWIHNNLPTVGDDWSISYAIKEGKLLELPDRSDILPQKYVPVFNYSKLNDPMAITSLIRLSDEYMSEMNLVCRYRVEGLYENGDRINFGLYSSDEPILENNLEENFDLDR